MDEPTNALEELSRDTFVKYLLRHAKQKISIVATHDQQLINSLGAKKLLLESNPINEFKRCDEIVSMQ